MGERGRGEGKGEARDGRKAPEGKAPAGTAKRP
jgi:hypothetical protein